ncbi:MAG: DUF84 family protein [Patescibacteria group bacterium]|jgi:non-canonical (house-cleaning) NTP pyrophosphatase
MATLKSYQKIPFKPRFAIGSVSPIKYFALCMALEELGVKYPEWLIGVVKAASGVNEQPFGPEETTHGARNRALAACQHFPKLTGLGIENGVIEKDGQFYDVGIVVVRMPDGTEFIEETEALLLPTEAVEKARWIGFNTITVGKVLSRQHPGWRADDPHIHLVGCSRISFLVPAIVRAIERANRYGVECDINVIFGPPKPSGLPRV